MMKQLACIAAVLLCAPAFAGQVPNPINAPTSPTSGNAIIQGANPQQPSGTGTIPSSQMPSPGASTLGGIESLGAVAHKWINAISTAGVPSATQPDVSDIAHNPIFAPPGYQSGPYYTQFLYNPTTVALSANTLYAIPFFAGVAKTFTKISIDVTAAGAATDCELGAYADNGSTAPGALLTDAGQTGAVTGTGQAELTGVSIAIVPGLNWLAVACNGTVTLEAQQLGISGQILGWSTGATANQRQQIAWTYSTGALPNPFGAGTLSSTNGPNVYLRF